MQIEAGKYYRTRDGRKVGPLAERYHPEFQLQGGMEEFGATAWRKNGTNIYSQDMDLIAEWTDGPVRTETVTTRRIVPGVYGRLRVFEGVEGIAYELAGNCYLTATELDDLAMVASQLAEALRDA